MVLLIDANIILDVLLNRPDFVKDSAMIWKLCETEQMKGYHIPTTMSDRRYGNAQIGVKVKRETAARMRLFQKRI